MREKKVVNTWEEVVQAFKEGREIRGKLVVRGKKPAYSWAWRAVREGIRDQVKREGEVLTYYLWGSPIAKLEGDILTLHNCGHATMLTNKRLFSIWRLMHPRWWDGDCRLAPCADGWRISWYAKTEPYPLIFNIRTKKLISNPDLPENYKRMERMRSSYRIESLYEDLKNYGPVPADLKDKILRKLMTIKLTEVA